MNAQTLVGLGFPPYLGAKELSLNTVSFHFIFRDDHQVLRSPHIKASCFTPPGAQRALDHDSPHRTPAPKSNTDADAPFQRIGIAKIGFTVEPIYLSIHPLTLASSKLFPLVYLNNNARVYKHL